MKICLIRHGETAWNSLGKLQGREDIPLNDSGIMQIRQTLPYFRKSKWEAIISSPLLRAKMSAEIIGKETGLDTIHEEAGFMERDLGKISGMTWEEVKKRYPDGNYEGTEPLDILQNRAVNALGKWINKFNGKDIVIVSHGATINSVLTKLSGNKIEMGKAIPGNAGISLLEKQGNAIDIVFYNKAVNELSL